MVDFWSSPNQIPIKSRGMIKKTNHLKPSKGVESVIGFHLQDRLCGNDE